MAPKCCSYKVHSSGNSICREELLRWGSEISVVSVGDAPISLRLAELTACSFKGDRPEFSIGWCEDTMSFIPSEPHTPATG